MVTQTKDLEQAYVQLLKIHPQDRMSEHFQRVLCDLRNEIALRRGVTEEEAQAAAEAEAKQPWLVAAAAKVGFSGA